MWFLVALLAITQFVYLSQGFATHMTRKQCDRPIAIGVEIMGQEAVYDDTRNINVFKNGIKVENGSVLGDSNGLTVTLLPKLFQIVLETSTGSNFTDGLCDDGKRTNTPGAELNILQEAFNIGKVEIIGAWAKGYSSGVKVTPPFVLHLSPTTGGGETSQPAESVGEDL